VARQAAPRTRDEGTIEFGRRNVFQSQLGEYRIIRERKRALQYRVYRRSKQQGNHRGPGYARKFKLGKPAKAAEWALKLHPAGRKKQLNASVFADHG
jgi:hypothetical protein